MNLVRFVDYFPPFKKIRYGLSPVYYYLSKEQLKLGIKTHVICKGYPREKRFEEIEGINIHRVATPYNVTGLWEFINLNRHVKVDLVHAHATSFPSYAIFRSLLHSKLTRTKYVVHIHGTTKGVMSAYGRFIPNFYNEVISRLYMRRLLSNLRQNIMWKKADALIAVSESVKNELESLYHVPGEKIHVVHNGVDLESFYPQNTRNVILKEHGLDPSSHVILYLGGFRPVKGPMYLIKALARIPEELKDIRVLFVGDPKHPLEKPYAKPMMDLIHHLKLNHVIRIIENIPYGQLPKYYSAVDALVVPSIYEALGKVVLEAMACGAPVIASAVGGLTELIQDGKNGVLTKPASPGELAEAILNLTSNPILGKKLGLNARRLIEKQFTWSHSAKHLFLTYSELLKS